MNPLLGVVVFLVILAIPLGVHTIPEGHVGVYWRGGALLTSTSTPGWNLMIPYVTSFAAVQVTLQTDKVTNIPCGTAGGVLVYFDRIEVVNQLSEKLVYETVANYTIDYDKTWIFDKIHHEINQFCSSHTLQDVYIDMFSTVDDRMVKALQNDCDKWAPGIKIIAVRITKPRIPDTIRRNYEKMELEKTSLMVAANHQLVVEKEAETSRKKAIIDAERVAAVSAISMEQDIMMKGTNQKKSAIADTIWLIQQRSAADALFYRATKESEADKLRLTPQYLALQQLRAVVNNSRVFFGSKLPNIWVGGGAGGLMGEQGLGMM